MGSVFSCKLNPCCGDRRNCTPPQQYYEQPSTPDRVDVIFQDIRDELGRARKTWGNKFDGKNTANDWLAYIVHYAGRAVTMPWNPLLFRESLIKVAGLCVSAIEQIDAKVGRLPKRHYD